MSVHDLQLHSESYIDFFLSVSGSPTGWIVAAVLGPLVGGLAMLGVIKLRSNKV